MPRWIRWQIQPEELAVLETTFARTPRPDRRTRAELATRLGRTPRQIQVWFQNQRQRGGSTTEGKKTSQRTLEQSPGDRSKKKKQKVKATGVCLTSPGLKDLPDLTMPLVLPSTTRDGTMTNTWMSSSLVNEPHATVAPSPPPGRWEVQMYLHAMKESMPDLSHESILEITKRMLDTYPRPGDLVRATVHSHLASQAQCLVLFRHSASMEEAMPLVEAAFLLRVAQSM